MAYSYHTGPGQVQNGTGTIGDSSGELRVLRYCGGGRWSLIGQEFKMVDEILPSDWPISSQSVIKQ